MRALRNSMRLLGNIQSVEACPTTSTMTCRFVKDVATSHAYFAIGGRVHVQCATIPKTPVSWSRFDDQESGSSCLLFGYVLQPELYNRGNGHCTVAEQVYRQFLSNGPDLAFDQNGIYCVLLYDRPDNVVYCAIDKYGMFPLFYGQNRNELHFGNNFFDVCDCFQQYPDFDALEEYLELGAPLGNKTFFRDIRKLEGGTFLIVRPTGGHIVKRFWSFHNLPYQGSEDCRQFIGESIEIFRHVIQRCLAITETPVCLISSGWDSRRILLEMLAQSAHPKTYTLEDFFGESLTPVSIDAAIVEKLLGERSSMAVFVQSMSIHQRAQNIERREQQFGFQTDIHEDFYPLIDAIVFASGTNYDGIAGDTLFANPFYSWSDGVAQLYERPDLMAAEIARSRYRSYLSKWFCSNITRPLCERVQCALEQFPANPNRLCLFGLAQRTSRVVSLFASQMLAMKIESIAPYLDDTLFRHALSVSPFLKKTNCIQRRILDEAYPEFASVPSSHCKLADIPQSYFRDMSHKFDNRKYACFQSELSVVSLAHALRHSMERSSWPLFSLKGRTVCNAAQMCHASGIDAWAHLRFAKRFWAVPRLKKLERIVNYCKH